MAFVVLILLVRGGLVYVATRTTRVDGQPAFDGARALAMALFASTGLPIIVAVTAVAVSAGEMTDHERLGAGGRRCADGAGLPAARPAAARPALTRIG